MSAPEIELLDIVCHPSPEVPLAHRLAVLKTEGPPGLKARSSAGNAEIPNAMVARCDGGVGIIIAIPDVGASAEVVVTLGDGESLAIRSGPVEPFDVLLMPTSHLCFGYFTGLPEHVEAGRVVAEAVDLLGRHPAERWNVEYCRAMENFVAKYPEKLEAARKHYREGRLGISPIWAPAFFENYDSESQVRQLTEAQWWLRESFGALSHVAMACDSPGFDPQQPQILRQAGIDFFFRCRYSLWTKSWGSPLIWHHGVDGSRLPCLVSRSPVSDGYIFPAVPEMWAKGYRADRQGARFGEVVMSTARYVQEARMICGVGLGVHFAGTDQSQADSELSQRLQSWNRIFRTPRLSLATLAESAARIISTRSFRSDEQEGEQPTWAPASVAGYRLTGLLQEAGYALATAEKASAFDLLLNSTPYPERELQTAWIGVLAEQQHEQLGHAGAEAVERAREVVSRSVATARDITACACRRIANKITHGSGGRPVAVFNFLNWARKDIVELPWREGEVTVRGPDGEPVPHHVSPAEVLGFLASVDGLGYSSYSLEPGSAPASLDQRVEAGADWIENEHYRLRADPRSGCIMELRDKELRHDILDVRSDRLPFELVIGEDEGTGYCAFWPTGRSWRASEIGRAKLKTEVTRLFARLVVERPLLASEGEARVGARMKMVFTLPAGLKRLDAAITLEWDSPHGREARLFIPVNLAKPQISYDTLFSTSDFDEELPARQRLMSRPDSWPADSRERPVDWRNLTRFASAYETKRDIGITLTAPHGLLRVEHGGVSFPLVEDRTSCYVHMIPSMKGPRVFHTSLTSHRGDWKQARSWRLGWERRGRFNDLVPVYGERLYALLPPKGLLAGMQGDNLVLTTLKKAHLGEELVARVYDASGDGDSFGFALASPYAGQRPFEIGQVRHGAVAKLHDRPLRPLALIKAQETNLLEETLGPISLEDLAQGRVRVRPHGIMTARLGFEQPQRSWIPTYEIRTGEALDAKEAPT